jgi:triacylglycerol lipase
MTADRNKSAAERVGRLSFILTAGAVISCGGMGVAWADDDGSPASGHSQESRPAAAAHARTADASPDKGSASADNHGSDVHAGPRKHRTDATKHRPDADTPVQSDDTEGAEEASPAKDPGSDTTSTANVVTRPGAAHVNVADKPLRFVKKILPAADDIQNSPQNDTPQLPVAAPVLWSMLGAAHRESKTATPVAAEAQSTAAPSTKDVSVADPPDWEQLYTGKPSLVHDVVVVALKAIQFVLKPFGGLLTFTSLKIPIFTDGIPPFHPWGMKIQRSEFEGMPVWTLTPKNASDKVVVALHGGAYVGQVSIFHWWTYTDMARDSGATFVVPLYTLAPKGTASTEVPRTADFLSAMITQHGAQNVSVLGDSAGGGLALATVQELVRRKSAVPGRMVLLAPWLDVSMSDPRSAQIDDPLLDIPNLAKAGKKWAGDLPVTNPLVSPLFGSLEGLPPTHVYSSSRDLLTVDTLRLRDRVLAEGIPDVTFNLRKGLIHDYATFPFLPEAQEQRASIYADLLGTSAVSV